MVAAKSDSVKGVPGHGARLDWVEAGRGLAATAVMMSHIHVTHEVPIDKGVLGFLGSTGVAFFFALSGFIMLHIHRGDIGHPETAAHFIWRRLGRIFPTYYVALFGTLAVNLVLQKASSHVAISPGFMVRQLLIAPGQGLFLGPAWTLRSELFFYLLFIALLINRRFGIAVLGAWLAVMLSRMLFVGIWTREVDVFPDLYIHFVNLYFFEGLGVAMATKAGRLRAFILINAALAGVLIPLAYSSLIHDRLWMLALGFIPLHGALMGLTVALSFGQWRAPRFLVWLGAISYSLYLTHLAVFTVLRGVDHVIGRPLDPIWPVRVLLQLAASIAVAALLHHLVEQPVLRWVGKRRTIFGINVARTRAPVTA
jgi:exopolysaccharide production protein ExoZ